MPGVNGAKDQRPGAITHASFRRPRLHLQELAAFEVDFTLPRFASTPRNYIRVDHAHRAAQVGWVEVLMAAKDMVKEPSPMQRDVRIEQRTLDRLLVWRQTRRLVVPMGCRVGTSMRAVLPLQPEIESPVGDCDVWVRLIAHRNDIKTPWFRATPVRLTAR